MESGDMAHDEKRFDPQRKRVLLDPEREAHWQPTSFLSRLGVKPGQTVLDLGSGPGFWTLPLAGLVGAMGQVVALDVSRELLDDLAARNPPSQVRLVTSKLPQIDLAAGSVDLAWAAFVFHEVEPPAELAGELRRVVRPSGRVAVLDWRPDAVSEAGPRRAHRVSPEQVVAFLAAAGFTEARMTWQDNDTYLVEAA